MILYFNNFMQDNKKYIWQSIKKYFSKLGEILFLIAFVASL